MSFNQHNEFQPTQRASTNKHSVSKLKLFTLFQDDFFWTHRIFWANFTSTPKKWGHVFATFFWGGVPGTWDPNLPPELGPRKNSVKKKKKTLFCRKNPKNAGELSIEFLPLHQTRFGKVFSQGNSLGFLNLWGSRFRPLKHEKTGSPSQKKRRCMDFHAKNPTQLPHLITVGFIHFTEDLLEGLHRLGAFFQLLQCSNLLNEEGQTGEGWWFQFPLFRRGGCTSKRWLGLGIPSMNRKEVLPRFFLWIGGPGPCPHWRSQSPCSQTLGEGLVAPSRLSTSNIFSPQSKI